MRLRRPKTVLVTVPEPEMDPNLLLLDGRDVRAVSRKERRAHGFRGPVMQGEAPGIQRFIRRNGGALTAVRTRKNRRRVARIKRLVRARGLA